MHTLEHHVLASPREVASAMVQCRSESEHEILNFRSASEVARGPGPLGCRLQSVSPSGSVINTV